MAAQKYHIKLANEERKKLELVLGSKKFSMETKKHAQILLSVDENIHDKLPLMSSIAAQIGVSEATIWKIRKRYAESGLDNLLGRKKRGIPPRPSIVTGDIEAHIIAICCSAPPAGQSRWTLKMIANKIVLCGIMDKISSDTVRRVLKKHNLNLT